MFGIDVLDIGAPLAGRRHFQGVPCSRTKFSHDVEVMPRAARAVGILAILACRVILFGIARSLPDSNAIPVSFEFISENHRDAGTHALAHFDTAAGDGHLSVIGDLHEKIRLRFRGPRMHLAHQSARYQIRPNYQCCCSAGAFQEVAPAQINDGSHITPPVRPCAPRQKCADRFRNDKYCQPYR